MRILVVGDSYIPTDVFRRGFESIAPAHDVEFLQLDESSTPLGLDVREYTGDPSEITERMLGVEVLVVHAAPVTGAVLESSDALRLVCCARGGPVNVNIAVASRLGVPVTTAPAKNAEAVADQTLAFMVMLARYFPRAQRFVRDSTAVGGSALEGGQFLGHDLGGHVLGLVGYGNVGRRVARRALAFNMRVVAFDPFVGLEDADVELTDTFEALLDRADFVSVHARATPENENLLDRDAFARMRRGSYFVNTARHTLVDEDALDEALTSGQLAGAALDVVRPRSGASAHPLLRHDNVVLTPHIGGATHETLLRGATMLAAEVERFTSGVPLVNVINPPAHAR